MFTDQNLQSVLGCSFRVNGLLPACVWQQDSLSTGAHRTESGPSPTVWQKGPWGPRCPTCRAQPANTAWKYGRRVAATQQGKHCRAEPHLPSPSGGGLIIWDSQVEVRPVLNYYCNSSYEAEAHRKNMKHFRWLNKILNLCVMWTFWRFITLSLITRINRRNRTELLYSPT